MSPAGFAAWLEGYRHAWETLDPEAVGTLFAEDAQYTIKPFDAPLRGRAAIMAYWARIARRQAGVTFNYDILATTGEQGLAHWSATFARVPSGRRVRLDGILLVVLNADGQCAVLREWWHSERT